VKRRSSEEQLYTRKSTMVLKFVTFPEMVGEHIHPEGGKM
jgi:hypothetical protein